MTSSARRHEFPVPLSSTAEQLYTLAATYGYGRQDDSGLVRIFTPSTPTLVHMQANSEHEPTSEDLGATETRSDMCQTGTALPSAIWDNTMRIGFIGLGAMGLGMAASLVKAGFDVCGYDVYGPSLQKFKAICSGARVAKTPADAAKNAQVLIIMVQNVVQAEDILFGTGKVTQVLAAGSVVIMSSTVPPSSVRSIGQRLATLSKNISLIDAPVSGGVVRAAEGQLTVCYIRLACMFSCGF